VPQTFTNQRDRGAPDHATTKQGVLVASRSKGTDGREEGPTPSPLVNAIQKDKKGDFDAHLIVLTREKP
jgi:hypothetical protein